MSGVATMCSTVLGYQCTERKNVNPSVSGESPDLHADHLRGYHMLCNHVGENLGSERE